MNQNKLTDQTIEEAEATRRRIHEQVSTAAKGCELMLKEKFNVGGLYLIVVGEHGATVAGGGTAESNMRLLNSWPQMGADIMRVTAESMLAAGRAAGAPVTPAAAPQSGEGEEARPRVDGRQNGHD